MQIYAVVGASAVCVVCYVIPVFIQLVLRSRQQQQRKQQLQAQQVWLRCGGSACGWLGCVAVLLALQQPPRHAWRSDAEACC